MNVMSILAEQIKAGRVKPHHILSQVKTLDPAPVGDKQVRFRKVKTGEFHIEVADLGSDKWETVETADSPVSAKLAFIDKLVSLVPDENGGRGQRH
jgi:hypothetical protein